MTEPTFTGSADQKTLAERVFKIMTAQGALFAADAPIRQTLSNLADFFAAQQKTDRDTVATQIDTALSANSAVFSREERDGDVVYITSKEGSYTPRSVDVSHMFKRRLYEPENPLPVDDISVVVTTTRPALTTVEPVFISDYWQRQVGILPPEDETASDEAPAAVTLEAAPVAPAPVAEAPAETVETAPVAAPVEEASEPVVVAEEIPVAASASSTMLTLPNGVQIDLRRPVADLFGQYGNSLVAQFRTALENDPLRRIVAFGSDVFPEAMVANFGKNDLRRIRDYIQQERQQPLLDTEIIADLFYHNPRQADYEAFRFSLNYRLSKEKDFEFVGVDGARLWATKGLPTVGSKRLKASDMGQITGYLEEGFDDSLRSQSAESIRKSGQLLHTLSFFEWEYGILPFTRALAALLPPAMLSDQRTAVLRVDSPQRYTSMLVELRYPTGNRGGWVSGLESFFHENLVPGTIITLARTEEPQVLQISYEEQNEQEDRLLIFDDKKNKFTFADVSYFTAIDPALLPSQQRYGRLRNLKALPLNERRKGEEVLEHVANVIGEPVGTRTEPRYMISADDVLLAMNVLRPTSASYLEHLLRDSDRFEADADTTGVWYYTPQVVASEPEAKDDDYDDYDDE